MENKEEDKDMDVEEEVNEVTMEALEVTTQNNETSTPSLTLMPLMDDPTLPEGWKR